MQAIFFLAKGEAAMINPEPQLLPFCLEITARQTVIGFKPNLKASHEAKKLLLSIMKMM